MNKKTKCYKAKEKISNLSYTMTPSLSLQVILRVPVTIIDYHCVCRYKVNAQASGLCAQKEDEPKIFDCFKNGTTTCHTNIIYAAKSVSA